MWKLLIAEDEYEIRDGLCNYVDWSKFDIELVKSTNNGKEALEYMLNNHIDILLTDIVMPYMDGIDLIREMQKHNIKTIPVIISVHWNKEYLKSAFKLEVMDYILKPINLKELYATIEKVVKKCEKAREYNNIKLNLEKRLNEMAPILKERLLYKLISGIIYDKDVLNKHIQEVKLNINPADKCIFITLRYLSNDIDLKKSNMLNLMIEDIFKEIDITLESVLVQLNNSDLGLILVGDKASDYDYVENIIHILLKELSSKGIKVIAGIGQYQLCISEISFSRKQAEKALDYSSFFIHNDIFQFNDMVNLGMKQVYPGTLINNIIDKVNLGDINGIEEAVNIMFDKLIPRYKNDEMAIKQICFDLINRLYNDVESEKNIDTRNILISINNIKTIKKLKDFVKSYFIKITQKQYDIHNAKHNLIIDEILKYIDDNYSSNITLKLLSDKFYFSPNYISSLFKRYKGVSFSEHLTNIRIEQSKILMKKLNLKLYNIANMVGYEDADYFSKKFKQVTGTTPSIWRSKTKK